jgi:hypothetical protein
LKLRVLSLAVALTTPLAGVRGLCFMSFELPGATPAEHECCKTGMKLARPNCCMAVTGEQAPARTASRISSEMTTTVFVWPIIVIDSTMTCPLPTTDTSQHEHDPPERMVLRI